MTNSASTLTEALPTAAPLPPRPPPLLPWRRRMTLTRPHTAVLAPRSTCTAEAVGEAQLARSVAREARRTCPPPHAPATFPDNWRLGNGGTLWKKGHPALLPRLCPCSGVGAARTSCPLTSHIATYFMSETPWPPPAGSRTTSITIMQSRPAVPSPLFTEAEAPRLSTVGQQHGIGLASTPPNPYPTTSHPRSTLASHSLHLSTLNPTVQS